MKTVTLSNGIILEYTERGDASGTPIVFLHGVTDSYRCFEPILSRLPLTLHAFAISQRGHGGSSKPEGAGYGYSDMAGDLRAFMDALHIPSAIVVGHSMGSMVAQRFAIEYPDRVAGIVLMGAFRTIRGDPAMQEYWDSELSQLADPIDRRMATDFQVSTLARPVPAAFLEGAIDESMRVPAHVWRATFRSFLDTPDFSPELAHVSAPTLIMWGELDAYTHARDQEVLRNTIPGARFIGYAGAGHAFHWEDPDRFVGDLLAFVREAVLAPV